MAPLGDICQRPSPFVQVLALIAARKAFEADFVDDFPLEPGVPVGALTAVIRFMRASSAAIRDSTNADLAAEGRVTGGNPTCGEGVEHPPGPHWALTGEELTQRAAAQNSRVRPQRGLPWIAIETLRKIHPDFSLQNRKSEPQRSGVAGKAQDSVQLEAGWC